MKFMKNLKVKKAMTPLMIGIIIAAAVLTILFIVLTATIPLMRHDVSITIPVNTIKGNETNRETLQFSIVCDYADGRLTKIQIYKEVDSTLKRYGEKVVDLLLQERNVTKYTVAYFEADPFNVPSEQINGTHLLFIVDDPYILKITYENISGVEKVSENIEFYFREKQ